jgi:hypothetical protein
MQLLVDLCRSVKHLKLSAVGEPLFDPHDSHSRQHSSNEACIKLSDQLIKHCRQRKHQHSQQHSQNTTRQYFFTIELQSNSRVVRQYSNDSGDSSPVHNTFLCSVDPWRLCYQIGTCGVVFMECQIGLTSADVPWWWVCGGFEM